MTRPDLRTLGLWIAIAGIFLCAPAAHAILGGSLSSEHPSVGALVSPPHPDYAQARCTATLVGCETVVTAAHCVCGNATCSGDGAADPSDVLFFLPNAGFFTVASISVHPRFHFPAGDLAVLKLDRPVAGVSPPPIRLEKFTTAAKGNIAGFGTTGRMRTDFGLKRTAEVDIKPYPGVITLHNQQASACFGDSGGPVFVDGEFAAVMHHTNNPTCVPYEGLLEGRGFLSNDSRGALPIAGFTDFVLPAVGTDLGATCGSLAPVGAPGTEVSYVSDRLEADEESHSYAIDIDGTIASLAIAMNAEESDADFDLYVKRGSRPTLDDYDCRAAGPSQLGFCHFAEPDAGIWYVRVVRFQGSGTYQLTTTRFAPASP